MGESSAEGVPYNRWLSIGKIVAWKLAEAIPARPIHLNVIARSGDTLGNAAQDPEQPEPAPRPAHHLLRAQRILFASLVVAEHRPLRARSTSSSLGRDRRRAIERFSSALHLDPRNGRSMPNRDSAPPSDTGRSLVDVPNYTAIEYSSLLTDFRRRLEELVSYAERVGAMPILILPPANDAGFEPNRSFLPPSTAPNEREAFGRRSWHASSSKPSIPAAAMRALSGADRPPALLRGNALPVGRAPRTSRRLGRSLSGIRGGARPGRHADALPEPLPASLS